jgi:hypothetical protein
MKNIYTPVRHMQNSFIITINRRLRVSFSLELLMYISTNSFVSFFSIIIILIEALLTEKKEKRRKLLPYCLV